MQKVELKMNWGQTAGCGVKIKPSDEFSDVTIATHTQRCCFGACV